MITAGMEKLHDVGASNTEANIFDNLIIKSSSRERVKP